jgi:hypothetical protein
MKNFNDQLSVGFKKYILFPISTSLGALVSALVILGSTIAAILVIGSGFVLSMVSWHGKRNFNAANHK